MQDKAIVEIGRLKADKKDKPFQDFIQNLFPGKDYDMVLVIFDVSNIDQKYTCRFERIDSEKGSVKNYLRYAYRKGSSRGGDITFTTKLNNIEKLFSTISIQLNKLIAFCETKDLHIDLAFFSALKRELEQKTEQIKTILNDQFGSVVGNPKIPLGFSFCFIQNQERLYLEDFESIQQLLHETATTGKSKKYNVVSEGHDELCSICRQKKPVLHGFASPYKYATVDKTGLVSGFFKQKNNWKNYPICTDCALDFEMGQKYITNNLRRSFYGRSYYIIPKLTVGSDRSLLQKALSVLDDLEYQPQEQSKIATREDYLMRKVAKEAGDHNQFTLNLLFFEENPTTKAIKIKLLLEQVFPSRFRTLFVDVPNIVNRTTLFKDAITIKKERQDLVFSFRIFKDFFDDDFYRIIQTVFVGLPIAHEALFSRVMQLIRKNYNKAKSTDGFVEPTTWTVLKAMMMVMYLKELYILPKNNTSISMEIPNDQTSAPLKKNPAKGSFDIGEFQKFIHTHKDFFDLDSGYKAGIFAVGVLVRQVFNWQARNLEGNTPFEKKLKGYHLNAVLLKSIYVEALDKLTRYSNFHAYKDLRSFINEYFTLNSHQLNDISNNELSFYFVAGLELGNQFKTENQKNHE